VFIALNIVSPFRRGNLTHDAVIFTNCDVLTDGVIGMFTPDTRNSKMSRVTLIPSGQVIALLIDHCIDTARVAVNIVGSTHMLNASEAHRKTSKIMDERPAIKSSRLTDGMLTTAANEKAEIETKVNIRNVPHHNQAGTGSLGNPMATSHERANRRTD
jgi:hypothetical protein